MEQKPQRLSCINFIHCLLVALWEYNNKQWSPHRDTARDGLPAFPLSVANAYWHLQEMPEAAAVNFRFRVNTDMWSEIPVVNHALNFLVMCGAAFRPDNGRLFELTMHQYRDCTRIWKAGVVPKEIYQALAIEWIWTYTDPQTERQWIQQHDRELILVQEAG